MASLHQVSSITKKLILIVGILFLLIILIGPVTDFALGIKDQLFPKPPPAPTIAFGKLPPIQFPKNANNKTLSFSINTLTGLLPLLPDLIPIYTIAPDKVNLFSLNRASDKVSSVGFSSKPLQISDTIYQWNDTSTLKKKLTLDIFSYNFDLLSSYQNDSEINSNHTLPSKEEAGKSVKSLFSSIATFPQDIDEEKNIATLLSISGSQLIEATSISTAHLIRIDFFQKDVNKIPIYYPHPPFSTMHGIVGLGNEVTEAHFHHFNLEEGSSTYPIITSQEAYEVLKNQKAYIASFFGNTTNIQIKNVFLAYYLGQTKQQYMTPIIVFQGDNGFYAFVSAIQDKWIQK